MESSSVVRASDLFINRNRSSELGLPDIQRIENIHEFMATRRTSPPGIQKLIESLVEERNQCAEALTQMKEHIFLKKALKKLIKRKKLELQSNLKKGSDKPGLIECDVTTALQQYKGQMKIASQDISKLEDDIKFVAYLHEIAVMNINDVNYWNDL